MIKLCILAFIGATFAQDTHNCPDGWVVSDIGDKVECILLGGVNEKVTKEDAEVLCAFHDAWLVDMDEGHGPQKNNFLKSLISDEVGNGGIGFPGMQYDDQWWIGATVHGQHDDHNWGDWRWDHTGESVEWYDWMRNEPNDWHSQNCLTFLKDQDIFGFGTYHWNDWDCKQLARYICERDGDGPPTEPPTEEPTEAPTDAPTDAPTEAPTDAPTEAPTAEPTEAPTEAPTDAPTDAPTEAPTDAPTDAPTEAPTADTTE